MYHRRVSRRAHLEGIKGEYKRKFLCASEGVSPQAGAARSLKLRTDHDDESWTSLFAVQAHSRKARVCLGPPVKFRHGTQESGAFPVNRQTCLPGHLGDVSEVRRESHQPQYSHMYDVSDHLTLISTKKQLYEPRLLPQWSGRRVRTER